jgi:HD-GYP domain-containing protein (c-di-GMP phosphodiesterase class II)
LRRISVDSAQMGMTLARDIYDTLGKLVLEGGTTLDVAHMPVLSRLEVGSIIVQDSRVDDVVIVPLIPEDVEAQAVRLVYSLLAGNQAGLPEHIKIDLQTVARIIKRMIQGFYSTFMGEINPEGCRSKGNFEYIHPVKVAELSMMIGKEAGLSRPELELLGEAALLQNVGYTLLPDGFITNLNVEAEEKSSEFRKHPEMGHRILSHQKDLDARIAEAVWQHHEQWDGKGYPQELKGDKISTFARIIAIARTYHALVSERRGQKPYSPPEAAEFIVAFSGELFDPALVQTFIRNVPLYPKGVMVKLSSGEKGIVTDSKEGFIGRPVVRICYGRNGMPVDKPYSVDLTGLDQQNRNIADILDY